MPFFSRLSSAIHPATEDCKRKNPSKGHFEQSIVLKEETAWLLPVQGSEHVAPQPAVARRGDRGSCAAPTFRAGPWPPSTSRAFCWLPAPAASPLAAPLQGPAALCGTKQSGSEPFSGRGFRDATSPRSLPPVDSDPQAAGLLRLPGPPKLRKL